MGRCLKRGVESRGCLLVCLRWKTPKHVRILMEQAEKLMKWEREVGLNRSQVTEEGKRV